MKINTSFLIRGFINTYSAAKSQSSKIKSFVLKLTGIRNNGMQSCQHKNSTHNGKEQAGKLKKHVDSVSVPPSPAPRTGARNLAHDNTCSHQPERRQEMRAVLSELQMTFTQKTDAGSVSTPPLPAPRARKRTLVRDNVSLPQEPEQQAWMERMKGLNVQPSK